MGLRIFCWSTASDKEYLDTEKLIKAKYDIFLNRLIQQKRVRQNNFVSKNENRQENRILYYL